MKQLPMCEYSKEDAKIARMMHEMIQSASIQLPSDQIPIPHGYLLPHPSFTQREVQKTEPKTQEGENIQEVWKWGSDTPLTAQWRS